MTINDTGKRLYEEYAKDMPVYDFHCHLSAKEIADDKVLDDIGSIMLEHDHYKWRLMRFAGIDEELITGDASWRDKFIAYAGALEKAVGNPLFVWTNMELQKYFGVTEVLTSANAAALYDMISDRLSDGSFSVRKVIGMSNVELIATTDDPVDDLGAILELAEDRSFKTRVVPTFRPDRALEIGRKDYREYITKLGASAGLQIRELGDLLKALENRMDYFAGAGCRISDHSLPQIPVTGCSYEEAAEIFNIVIRSDRSVETERKITEKEEDDFAGYMMKYLACEYQRRDWTMQLHLFALRNQNSSMYERLGADAGFDSVGDVIAPARRMCRFLDEVSDAAHGLPRTMVYALEPSAYHALSTALGNSAGVTPGRLQLGAAWWFCDHQEGIVEQLKVFAATGILGMFNGMLTDSRSFLSYVRHDYFRQIVCSFIGREVEEGRFPDDDRLLGNIIRGISYENAKRFFGM